jgi:hypothetical protein
MQRPSAAQHTLMVVSFSTDFEYLSRLSRHRQLIPAFLQFGRVAFSRCHFFQVRACSLALAAIALPKSEEGQQGRLADKAREISSRGTTMRFLVSLAFIQNSLVNVNPAFMDVFLEIYNGEYLILLLSHLGLRCLRTIVVSSIGSI